MPYSKDFESAWVNSFSNSDIRKLWLRGTRKDRNTRINEHMPLVLAITPELNETDKTQLFNLANACISDSKEERMFNLAVERQWILNAAVRAGRAVTDLRAQAAHTARYSVNEETIEVMLDNDQMKHQPRSVPIGTRVAEGEKFPTHKASKAWHEDNTMRFMALWAANTPLVEGGRESFNQGEKYLVDTLGISFEGTYLVLNNEKYVLFHCYPNSRAGVPTNFVPWNSTIRKL
ncbi:MAG: hypothetical protein V4660_20060 [Pseudomonadota bacterium]